jgi:bacillolysin
MLPDGGLIILPLLRKAHSLKKSINMFNKKPIFILMLLFGSTALFGQQIKPHLENLKSDRTTPLTLEDLQIKEVPASIPASQNNGFPQQSRQYQTLSTLVKPVSSQQHLKIHAAKDTGLPIVIEGKVNGLPEGDLTAQSIGYLEAVGEALRIHMPSEEFVISKISTDNLGQTHIRMTQQLAGIPVYGSEILLHQQNGDIQLFNGRYYPTPTLENLIPTVSKEGAQRIATDNLALSTTFKELSDFEKILLDGEQVESELVIYHQNRDINREHLVWHFTVIPNIAARWSYFVDAHTGEILHQFSHICKFGGDLHHHHTCENDHKKSTKETTISILNNLPPDGPAVTNASDLFGINRTINTYEVSNTFFMIDGSRSMFNATQSNMPDEPVGSIWTIDAQNTSPSNNNFAAIHVTSNNNIFNNPSAVSAHYNGGKAYEYFANTFGRNSINGQGGNIISLVDVADENGSDMDNAFWSGSAMFYGNGDQAFTSPLSKALDVAGHEMSHGVIQTAANLEYQGESGALNESFADIFGAMIDRDNWQLGEDIVNTGIFSSGALRDLQNPNNGGNSLSDAGYQPDNVDDQFTGSQDNGGVHINSGITNRAYYLFATAIGKDKAEQIYYRALTEYLVRSSKFIDLRIAVIQAATDLHGATSTEVNAAKDALSAVGIGEGAGTQTQTDIGMNTGEEYILLSNNELSQLFLFTPDAAPIANPLSMTSIISKPSVTDDGSVIVFVDADKKIRQITIDWATGNTNEEILGDQTIWRNAAISKDGTKLAALTDDFDKRIIVFDLANGGINSEFTLYTPTTGSGGQTTNEVQYADFIEFDFTGEWILYDAYNFIENANGQNIDYWDIGFVKVFENSSNNFGDGTVRKLFSGLPENTSVGNPTFSKNSDYIIALDYIDNFNDDYAILGVNTETGETGTIYDHTQLGYANYSVADDRIVFDDVSGFFDDQLLSFVNLADNKISGTGIVEPFLDNGKWGVWFADGERSLVGTNDFLLNSEQFNVYPNPFDDNLKIDLDAANASEVSIEIFDVIGKRVFSQKMKVNPGQNTENLNLSTLNNGTFFLKMTKDDVSETMKISKF